MSGKLWPARLKFQRQVSSRFDILSIMGDYDNLDPMESQYSPFFNDRELLGNEMLGTMSSATWRLDPKRLGITLSRYKFVSKMFSGYQSVLEIGAGDAWASRIVLNETHHLTLSDFDPIWLEDFNRFGCYKAEGTEYRIHDFTTLPMRDGFDGAYALDVLEHIHPDLQADFLNNICKSLSSTGVAIFGMPSAESQIHASAASRAGHVNCQSGDELRKNLSEYFQHVFMFSMNDEVVHTGFMPMAHYLLALCVIPLKD